GRPCKIRPSASERRSRCNYSQTFPSERKRAASAIMKGLVWINFAGQALYVGPTLYATFGGRYFVSAAWNVQVWGAVAGSSGALDLVNFERHQAKLRVGITF